MGFSFNRFLRYDGHEFLCHLLSIYLSLPCLQSRPLSIIEGIFDLYDYGEGERELFSSYEELDVEFERVLAFAMFTSEFILLLVLRVVFGCIGSFDHLLLMMEVEERFDWLAEIVVVLVLTTLLDKKSFTRSLIHLRGRMDVRVAGTGVQIGAYQRNISRFLNTVHDWRRIFRRSFIVQFMKCRNGFSR